MSQRISKFLRVTTTEMINNNSEVLRKFKSLLVAVNYYH